jgi:hypothetical protein
MFHFPSFSALSSLYFLFIGIPSAKCIVVPLILKATFHVHANYFITFGFKGLTSIIFLM